jgi:hypothetical protein
VKTTAQGVGGHLEFDGQNVTVVKDGLFNRLTQMAGSHSVDVANIESIRFREATRVTRRGFIQFLRKDDPLGEFRDQVHRKHGWYDDLSDADLDEYSLVYGYRDLDGILKFKKAIEEAMGNAG